VKSFLYEIPVYFIPAVLKLVLKRTNWDEKVVKLGSQIGDFKVPPLNKRSQYLRHQACRAETENSLIYIPYFISASWPKGGDEVSEPVESFKLEPGPLYLILAFLPSLQSYLL